MSPLFHFVRASSYLLSLVPLFQSRFPRSSHGNEESAGRVVHVSFTSIIWRSVRLRESTIASNHAPIAIPVEKQLTSVDRVRFINRGKLYSRSLKRKYCEIISRRHCCRINNSPTRVFNVSGENCDR